MGRMCIQSIVAIYTHNCHQLKNQRGCLLPFTKCCLAVGGMCVRSIMAIRTTVNKATFHNSD